MRRRWPWLLAGVPLGLALLAVAAWLALDAWLESAGGRRAVERVLTEQSGYPVSLSGAFEVVLFPGPGVSGTDLLVHGAEGDDLLLQSGGYAVALALRPLLRRELEVDSLTLEAVRLGGEGGGAEGFLIPELAVTGFAVDRPAGLVLDLGPLGEVEGTFTWRPAQAALDLALDWGGFLFPRLELETRAAYDAGGLWFEPVAARIDGQALGGHACYRLDDGSGLHLDLVAGRIDLDALNFTLPDAADDDDGLSLRLRLAADEVVRGGTVARGVVFNLGPDPDCARPGA